MRGFREFVVVNNSACEGDADEQVLRSIGGVIVVASWRPLEATRVRGDAVTQRQSKLEGLNESYGGLCWYLGVQMNTMRCWRNRKFLAHLCRC